MDVLGARYYELVSPKGTPPCLHQMMAASTVAASFCVMAALHSTFTTTATTVSEALW